MPRLDSKMVLAAGVLVSAGMHLGLGVLVARYGRLAVPEIRLVSETTKEHEETPPPPPQPPEAEPPEAEPPPPPPPPKTHELKLGLTDAPDSASMAWLGFTEPTEHQAHEGITEQSAMSLNPAPAATREEPGSSASASAPAAPVPLAPRAPDPVTAREQAIAGAPEGDVEKEPPATPQPIDLRPVGKAIVEAGGKLAEAIGQALDRLPAAGPQRAQDATVPPPPRPESAPPPPERTAVAKGAKPVEAAKPEVAAKPPSPPPAGKPGSAGGMPGLKSDREAIAVSLKNAPVVVPGQVLAAQGLEVLTRAPRFDTLTVATQRPRNPAVRVFFGKDGKVKRAEFIVLDGAELNTGSSTVDRQLMNSIYAWTAKGRAVDELPKGDPEAAVSIVFTILLR